jgi:hypothetical protein
MPGSTLLLGKKALEAICEQNIERYRVHYEPGGDYENQTIGTGGMAEDSPSHEPGPALCSLRAFRNRVFPEW